MKKAGTARCAICGLADAANRTCDAYSRFTGHDEVLCRRHELEVHREILAVSCAPTPEPLPGARQ